MAVVDPTRVYERYIREVIGDEINDSEKLDEIVHTLGKYVFDKKYHSQTGLLSELIWSLYEKDREAIECDFARLLVFDQDILRNGTKNRFEVLRILLPLMRGYNQELYDLLKEIKLELHWK